MEWSLHLARRNPRGAVTAGLVIIAASVAAGLAFRSAPLGALACLLLIASLSDFLFPVRFLLDEHGAEARGLVHRRRMTWSQVRGVRRDELGVKLSPLARHSRLEAYRGIYLWFENNADDVMAFIAEHTRAEARAPHLPSA